MHPYRKEKVASVVQHVVGEAIAHRLHDPRVAPLTTVTRVEMTGDLLIAKVYLTVQGGEAVERRMLAGMRHAAGYIQRMLAGELSMRHCPELRFDIDESVKQVRRTMELLAENRRREPELYEPDGTHGDASCDETSPADSTTDEPSESDGVGG